MVKKLILSIRSSGIIKSLSVYFVSQLITALLPIIIIPIISRSLTLADYGSYSLYKSIFGVMIPLVGLSFSNAVIRKYYSIEKEHFRTYLFTLIFIISIATLLLSLILLFFMDFLLRILKIDDPSIIYYSLYVAYFTSISSIMLGYYRVLNDTGRYLVSNVIIVLITVLGVVLLKLWNVLDLNNLLLLHLLAIFASVLYNLFFFIKIDTKIKTDFSYLKDTFSYCMPLVLFSLLAQIYALGDRFFINYFLDKESLALYSAGLQMAFLIIMVGQSIQLAWTPYVFDQLTHKKDLKKLNKLTYIFCLILFVLSCAYLIIYPLIFKIFLPDSYNNILSCYYYFIIAGLFQSLYWLYNPFLLFYERNSYFVYLTIFTAIISCSLNYLFVKRGLEWIAAIFAFSWLIQFVCLLIIISYVKNSTKNKQASAQAT